MLLWIDPWIRKLWYALIEDDLTIVDAGILLQDQKAPTRMDQFARMHEIYEFFVAMLEKYPVTHIAIEKLFFNANQNNAEFVYGIRWALCMLFRKHTIPLIEYTPQQIKKYVTGNGRAGKEMVQKMIQKIFQLKEMPKYDDTADALGLAWMLTKIKTLKH